MRPAIRTTLFLLLASMRLFAAQTAYVIPVASAHGNGRLYTTTLALRNDGARDAQCESIYAIPNDAKGGTLRATYAVPAGGHPQVDEDVLREVQAAGTLRLACSDEVVVIARIQSSRDEGVTYDRSWTFPGVREDQAISRGKVQKLTARRKVIVEEVAGRQATVEVIARNSAGVEVGRTTLEILPFMQKVADLSGARIDRSALSVELRVVAGDGAIVAADEVHDSALIKMAARLSDEPSQSSSDRQVAQAPAAVASNGPSVTQMLLTSPFKGAPFQDPMTGLIYMRNRWYDPKTGSFITPDPKGYTDSANLYSFCGGDPVNCSDPTGSTGESDLSEERRAMAAKRLAEAAASRRAAEATAMQRANDLHRAATQRMVALRRVGVDVKAGDIVMLTPDLEYGVTASGRVVPNPSSGRVESETTEMVLTAAGLKAASPAIGAAWRAGGAKAATPLIADEIAGVALGVNPSAIMKAPRAILNAFEAQRVLADLTRQVNAELAANPALAQTVLSPREYLAGVGSARIAAAQYGNAVERIIAARIRQDPALATVFRHVGGPSNPDFVAFGRNFDITTETQAQVMRHMKRPGYGNDLIVLTYERPTTFTTFPGGQ